ncbi:BnaA10g08300D [Brassica napus]|uniref:BnaA10g08300D protein n=1 Tax=Brassica napus TaxID=3708 RepID=A0A078HYP8_BRANA|nr:BnaA10g08300D [Brassica napus]
MGIVASKADHNTPLLNLCRERKELIRAARDARYHLAKSHLLYFQSLLDFTNALNQFVHKDLIVIPYSDDDSSSGLECSGSSDSDSESDSDSNSHCLACDESQAVPLSKDDDQNPQKPSSGEQACGSSNNVHVEKSSEGVGFVEKVPVIAPVKCEKRNSFHGHDPFGLYDFLANTELVYTEPDQRYETESDVWREIREREGIPDLESDSDHSSLVRKNQRKKNVQESSSTAKDKREVNISEVDKSDTEANTSNGKADDVDETCTQEKQISPETVTEVTRSDEELSDEAYESSSSSFCSGSGHSDLRNVVEKINSISKKAASNSEVSDLLEVSKVIPHQPLGSQFKELASRLLGSSKSSTRALLLRRGLPQDNLAVSLSMTLEKLYVWEKKLHAEVTAEEKLRVLYEKGYSFLKSLDQNGAEASEIYEAEAEVKLHLSKVNVSVRAVETVSMRIHKIRDGELSLQVNKTINVFKEMWRLLAKCHHKQFRAITRSKSCLHVVEKGSRKVTQKVEEQMRRFKESLRSYIDAHRGFVRFLNEWLNRNIMEEDDQTKTDAPDIFRVCSEWLREIVNVDEVKVLSAVEEMELRFRGLGFKQLEEEKQRLRTERLCKELETKTKEVEESWGAQAEEVMGPELLSLRESATHETEKHEGLIREINDAVSMSLQECLVHVFEALEGFCFGNFKAYQNIRIVSTETETLLLC